MEDELLHFKGLFATYNKVNKGKRNKIYYNAHNNNMILFTPYYRGEDEVDIVNSTISGYKYLVNVLNSNKNIIVHWSKVEGTTSDYNIFYDFDPSSFLKKSHREISNDIFRSCIANSLPMTKFNEVRNGKMTTIKKETLDVN